MTQKERVYVADKLRYGSTDERKIANSIFQLNAALPVSKRSKPNRSRKHICKWNQTKHRKFQRTVQKYGDAFRVKW
jgi:hypothetical protein